MALSVSAEAHKPQDGVYAMPKVVREDMTVGREGWRVVRETDKWGWKSWRVYYGVYPVGYGQTRREALEMAREIVRQTEERLCERM